MPAGVSGCGDAELYDYIRRRGAGGAPAWVVYPLVPRLG